MDDATLLQLSDLNLADFNRDSARGTAGGVVHDEAGLTCFLPSHRLPVGAVGAMRTDPRLPAADAFARAQAFFGERNTGFTMWGATHRDADLIALLDARGISIFGDRASPGMVVEQRLEDRPAPAQARIVRLTNGDGVRDFAHIAAVAYATYGMPPGIAETQFADADFWLAPHIAMFVAYVDGTAQAAAMTYLSHGIGGIYWVGTTPEARGRGLAEACTRVATNAGFDLGGRIVSLQASVMGEPIYRRMGYREITRYPWYLVMS